MGPSTPAARRHLAWRCRTCCLRRVPSVSASAMLPLSWLNPPPHPITVYASHPPLPTTTQHSLPGGALPPYRGRSLTGRNASASPDAPEIASGLTRSRGHTNVSILPWPGEDVYSETHARDGRACRRRQLCFSSIRSCRNSIGLADRDSRSTILRPIQGHQDRHPYGFIFIGDR